MNRMTDAEIEQAWTWVEISDNMSHEPDCYAEGYRADKAAGEKARVALMAELDRARTAEIALAARVAELEAAVEKPHDT